MINYWFVIMCFKVAKYFEKLGRMGCAHDIQDIRFERVGGGSVWEIHNCKACWRLIKKELVFDNSGDAW